MTTLTNKTRKPLSVPLPGNRTLYLGPGKSAEISSKSTAHAPLKKLLEAGEIEISDQSSGANQGGAGGPSGRAFIGGHNPGTSSRRSGDR